MQRWATDQPSNLSGKTAVITGSNSGIGYETALGLAKQGCKIIMACRDTVKANSAKASILQEVPNADIIVEKIDLSDFTSIKSFAAKLQSTHAITKLSFLINNAGINACPYSLTKDGNESIFQTNYLGPFLLTKELLPLLTANGDARIVTVTSAFHKNGEINFDNLNSELGYDYFKAYANSKLADILFAFELDRRLREAELPIKSIAVHPGAVETNILRHAPSQDFKHRFFKLAEKLLSQSSENGALPTLFACTAPNVQGGEFYGPNGFLELSGTPIRTQPSALAKDTVLAQQLWEHTETLIGEKFEIGSVCKPAIQIAV